MALIALIWPVNSGLKPSQTRYSPYIPPVTCALSICHMQSTFVIARRSKCRQNSPQDPRHLAGTDRNRLDEQRLNLQPRQTVPASTALDDDDDDEIFLI